MKSWDDAYQNSELLWGLEPNSTLTQYVNLVPTNGKVLDIGIGEGRNAFYFAQKGFAVEGIDLSETAIERCLALSDKYQLNIEAKVDDITAFDIRPNHYSLIILSNILTFFPEEEIALIIDKVKMGLVKDGLVYVNVFDINEPSRKKAIDMYKRLGRHSFFDSATNMFLHYFTKDELEGFFSTYRTIKTGHSYAMDLTHGEPHYHSTLELLAQKTLNS